MNTSNYDSNVKIKVRINGGTFCTTDQELISPKSFLKSILDKNNLPERGRGDNGLFITLIPKVLQ